MATYQTVYFARTYRKCSHRQFLSEEGILTSSNSTWNRLSPLLPLPPWEGQRTVCPEQGQPPRSYQSEPPGGKQFTLTLMMTVQRIELWRTERTLLKLQNVLMLRRVGSLEWWSRPQIGDHLGGKASSEPQLTKGLRQALGRTGGLSHRTAAVLSWLRS